MSETKPTDEDLRVARQLVVNAFDRHTIKMIEGNGYFRLVDGITRALADQREKAAQIVESQADPNWNLHYRNIAAAIRTGDKE